MHGAFVSVQDTHQGSFSNLSQAVDGSPKGRKQGMSFDYVQSE